MTVSLLFAIHEVNGLTTRQAPLFSVDTFGHATSPSSVSAAVSVSVFSSVWVRDFKRPDHWVCFWRLRSWAPSCGEYFKVRRRWRR